MTSLVAKLPALGSLGYPNQFLVESLYTLSPDLIEYTTHQAPHLLEITALIRFRVPLLFAGVMPNFTQNQLSVNFRFQR